MREGMGMCNGYVHLFLNWVLHHNADGHTIAGMENLQTLVSGILIGHSLTEAKLAERLGLNQSTVHRMKSGKTNRIDYNQMAVLLAMHDELKASA